MCKIPLAQISYSHLYWRAEKNVLSEFNSLQLLRICGYSGRMSDTKGSYSAVQESNAEWDMEGLGLQRVRGSRQLVRSRILQVRYAWFPPFRFRSSVAVSLL